MTNIKLLRRDLDVFDGSDLQELYTFNNVPIHMGCVSSDAAEDITCDMSWKISPQTGIIQLTNLIPLDILYQTSHTPGTVGSIWNQHHIDFSNFICKFTPDSVLEIGGSHGILSRKYHDKHSQIPWTIIEPAPVPQPGVPARFITGFFDENTDLSFPYDTIIHSHVLEHTYYPVEFLRLIYKKLNVGQKMIFSIPNMKAMLQKKYANCLNFEHTVYIDEFILDRFLGSIGFSIVAKEYFKDDHSIFYCCSKEPANEVDHAHTKSTHAYTENKQLFIDFVDYYLSLVDAINKMETGDHAMYLFGAHIFSQALIQFGLDTSRISGILDNDPYKHGKRLYGTDLHVMPPSVLTTLDSPYVIVNAGTYSDEIKNDITKNINSSATFI